MPARLLDMHLADLTQVPNIWVRPEWRLPVVQQLVVYMG
jgi:hypothetical protein